MGVHGVPATLHLEDLWIRNVTITTGLVDTYSTPTLLRLIEAGRIDAAKFATHRFEMSQFMEAYDTFYKRLIKKADVRFDQHLEALSAARKRKGK